MVCDDGLLLMIIFLEIVLIIEWEVDIVWIVRGGQDLFDWIECYVDWIMIVYVKDIVLEGECFDEDGWVDVGYGMMDWKVINSVLCNIGVDLFVVEYDNLFDLVWFFGCLIEIICSLQDIL